MNTYAPLEIQALREAKDYGDMWAEQEVRERQEAESDEKLNVALAAIRKCDLTAAQVRQVLMTLACEMKARGFCDADVELVDTASEVVG